MISARTGSCRALPHKPAWLSMALHLESHICPLNPKPVSRSLAATALPRSTTPKSTPCVTISIAGAQLLESRTYHLSCTIAAYRYLLAALQVSRTVCSQKSSLGSSFQMHGGQTFRWPNLALLSSLVNLTNKEPGQVYTAKACYMQKNVALLDVKTQA